MGSVGSWKGLVWLVYTEIDRLFRVLSGFIMHR
jgi:hypothetical protein